MPADLDELLSRARDLRREPEATLEELTADLEATLDQLATSSPDSTARVLARCKLTLISIKLRDFGYYVDDVVPRETLTLIRGGRDDAS